MWLSDVSVRRPVLATVLSILLVAFGALSYLRLPLRELPDVDPPMVSVETRYVGASGAVVETRITREIEKRLAGIEGIHTIESQSRQGVSRINIEFELDRDMEAAANDVRDRVSQSLDDLPDDSDPPEIYKRESDAQPIMWLDLSSETRGSLELTDYAERYLVDRFSVIDGVAQVIVSGAQTYSMRIWLDRIALAARELTVMDVADALRQQNVELPAGRLESAQRDFTVRVERSYVTVEDFESLVVARGGGGHLIRLSEVAKVEVGPRETASDFRGNGRPRVGLGIIRQSTANTVQVAQQVLAELERLQVAVPADIVFSVSWDSSDFVRAAVREVFKTFGIAMLLVVGVIYLFLGTRRAAVSPAITVPICVVGTFSAFVLFGLSVNLLTLLALVLSIGLVVDDSIVVLENIQRRIELGEAPLLAAYRGAREVGFAVIATTLVVIAVFVPIAFLDGLTGRLFRELAITVSAAVALSSFVALSLSTMLCSKLLVRRGTSAGLQRNAQRMMEALQARYLVGLRFFMQRPSLVAASILASGLGTALLFQQVPQELEPSEDRGAFMVIMRAPEGASFEYTLEHMKMLEDRVLFPMLERGEAVRVLTRVPFGRGSGISMNSGMVVIVLSRWDERASSADELMQRVYRESLSIPDIIAIPLGYGGLRMGGSSRHEIELVLGGSSHEEISRWQAKLLAEARKLPQVQNLDGSYKPTQPQLRVVVDRTRAADLGVSVASIGRTLEIMLGSSRITTYEDRGEERDVVLQARADQRASPRDLTNLYVRSDRSGEVIPLSNLVTLHEIADAGTLRRFGRLASATVGANPAQGYTLGDGLVALEALARDILPDDAYLSYKGQTLEFVESNNAAYFTFGLALLIVFLVLAAQFESFVHPAIIMLTVPLAIVGALAGLFLAGESLNIYSQIGMTILIGLAAKNGILIVEFANQLRGQGLEFQEAVEEAARTRLRPILMTGISTALGALPLVLGAGPGSGGRRSIGIVVFSGVLFATFFTIFVVPVAYALVARRTQLPGAIERRLESYELAEADARSSGS